MASQSGQVRLGRRGRLHSNMVWTVQVSLERFERGSMRSAGHSMPVDIPDRITLRYRAIAPTFDRLADKYKQAKFLKIDVDKHQDVSQSQGVRAMPVSPVLDVA